MGIKDDKNEWNIYGHPDRKIEVTDDVLKIVGLVFDGKASNGARMPELHASSYLHVYEKITQQKKYLKDVEGFWCNQFYNETSAKNEGLIVEKEGNPDDASQLVFLGPNIWIGNPYNKTARFPCVEKSDYDNVDLHELEDITGYLPRTKYFSTDGLRACAPTFENGEKYTNSYKILARRRLNLSMERSLISAIVPKKSLHVHSVLGIHADKKEQLLTIAACLNSVVFDFYIKTFGKEDLYENTLGNLPLFEGKLIKYLWSRVLLLNAIGNEYDELVEYILPSIDVNDGWARNNERLPKISFVKILSDKHFVASDYARRELLLEIDVLVSIMLGISIADLQNIYRLQFPVMKQYEEDTWYDIDGKIVYTCNKNIPSLSRKEWEEKKEQLQISTIIESNKDNENQEKEIVFNAPFICADRLSDYEEAWEYFSRLY